MTPHRTAWLAAVVVFSIAAAACESTPYSFGTVDGGGVTTVPDPEPVQCSADGGLVPPAQCPQTYAAMNGQPCDDELSLCDYQDLTSQPGAIGIGSCLCLWSLDGVKRWMCTSSVETHTAGCPMTPPRVGESCQTALSCTYIEAPSCECPTDFFDRRQTTCSCGQGLVWDCSAAPGCTPTPPSPVEPTKKVADLTYDEAITWCSWVHHTLWGDSLDPAPVPVVDGYATPGGGMMPSPQIMGGLQRCWIPLPHELCAKNLMLDGCQATVSMLDDCVISAFGVERSISSTSSMPGVHGRGCGPFELAPSCQRTFFQPFDSTAVSHDCRIPVE